MEILCAWPPMTNIDIMQYLMRMTQNNTAVRKAIAVYAITRQEKVDKICSRVSITQNHMWPRPCQQLYYGNRQNRISIFKVGVFKSNKAISLQRLNFIKAKTFYNLAHRTTIINHPPLTRC